ncbi:ankyrin repeat domain-containing protein 16-like [Paramacrobiotus metropolitanus]|uniref:ankyrin repeat domain-containing protein 16-like n=1 Tax=Paramacrobiotus metropolitanus TaxID=2943436 RepID=UPI0024463869|nr:ankyrin repeat domain-containing protein 16-like [Paramacrobiotus metropolitanus]
MASETYMRVLARFVVTGNVGKVWEKLTEIEELNETKQIPWPELINQPSKESLAVIASRYGQVGILKMLQMKGAPSLYYEIGNLDGKRPLHEAVENGQSECVEFLVETIGVCVNSLKRADWTPLMLACSKANPDLVRYLIHHDADVNFRNKDGWNAFHLACREGNLEIVKMLYKAGNDSSLIVSNNGRSPLHTAALHGHSTIVRFLLEECGYNPKACDASGNTPQMDANLAGHPDIAQLLESH